MAIFFLITDCGGPLQAQTSDRFDVQVEVLKTSIRPANAVLVGENVFYTDFRGNGEACIGKDIYRYSLNDNTESIVVSTSGKECVRSIQTDGTALWVEVNRGTLWRWDGNTLQRLPDWLREKHPVVFARWRSALRKSGWHEWEPDLSQIASASVELLYRGTKQYFWLTLPLGQKAPPPEAYATSLEVSPNLALMSLTRDGKGERYVAVEGATNGSYLGSILHLKSSPNATGVLPLLETVPLGTTNGQAIENANWTTLPKDQWAIRVPRFLSPTSEGFMVVDRSFLEPPSASFYSATKGAFFRVAPSAVGDDGMGIGSLGVADRLPANSFSDIGGAYSVEGGVLIAHPAAKKITWYGQSRPRFANTYQLQESK